MSDYSKYFTNPNFIGAYNASKEGSKDAFQKGIVYIEDDSDQNFWEKFINIYYPNQYNIQASIVGRPGIRGKRALEQFFDSANRKVVIAVDSDYDYICPNYKLGYYFNENKFIIHTFGFSRESALLEKTHIQSFLTSIKHTISHKVDFLSFINSFSKLAFKGLVLFTIELTEGNPHQLKECDFDSCFHILNLTIINESLEINYDLISIISERINVFFKQSNHPEGNIKSKEKDLNALGVQEDNAYRFISGHLFYDIITTLHTQLINQLRKLEIEKIRREFSGEATGNRIKQLNKIFNDDFSIVTHCRNYPVNDSDEIHSKIKERVSNF